MAKYQYEQFLLFGDSLTEYSSAEENGLAPALQKAYIRRMDIVNRGFDGYNTRQALQVLPYVIPSPEQARVRLITILLGANDGTLASAKNGMHVPLEQYASNLRTILSHPALAAHQGCRIVLITPPPIDEHLHDAKDANAGHKGLTRRSAVAKEYASACRRVGEEFSPRGVAVLDLWRAMMEDAGWRDGDDVLAGSLEAQKNMALHRTMSDGE
ncbi:hypothetical protein G7054_g10667 [Neopestalotiopsis clavispora]|nr:hypothetical protein G7054_g10667 [Neopestalotiopsis clavispora]